MEIDFKKAPYTRWLESVDNKLWKPDDRDLIILFWYMSVWKTEFVYYTARKNIENWIKVCFLSLELPEYDMKLRIARKSAWVNKIEYQNQDFTQVQKQIIIDKFNELENMKDLTIVKPERNDMITIDKTMRRYYDDWYRMFIIDNLDKISWKENDNTRYQEISSAFQDFKNENNVCIILLHHAKKPMNKEQQYRPAWMWWLRWSQKILDNATQVIEIHRDLDPDISAEEKKIVSLYQYKDTFDWANWIAEMIFHKWDYLEIKAF